MGGTVVIKWGGGLITHKDQLCTVNQTVIDQLAKVCSQSGKKLVIVHGAGSFGHMKAKKYRLSEGRIEGSEQDDAVEEVRSDMIKLNQSVVNSLQSHGLSVKSYPPHKWARGTGPDFSGELPVHDHVTVVYGDVVDDDDSEFGILSGDDIMLRYATELPDVERAVFAIGGVDGILRLPPSRAGPDDLIEIWHPGLEFEGEHASEIDVTGGIGLKAARGAMMAEKGVDVVLVNGEIPQRVLSAILGESVIGTRIISGNS
ncbi:MAG: hypothetical protein CMA11_00625 [Euryarchaeota archaeon]|nr:hypothetical protein [Euryarchaeota archaeon]|tara:strand:- start:93 stop:866 length:774 start_codon:yes stop_codon:yes gene_type:complete